MLTSADQVRQTREQAQLANAALAAIAQLVSDIDVGCESAFRSERMQQAQERHGRLLHARIGRRGGRFIASFPRSLLPYARASLTFIPPSAVSSTTLTA